jgi:hypothetical protein
MNNIDYDILGKNLEFYGQEYVKEHLTKWKDKNLESDWLQALNFFFSHSFMRGRKDELSNEYYFFTMDVLAEFFNYSDDNLHESSLLLKKTRIEKLFNTDDILQLKKVERNSLKHPEFEISIKPNNTLIEKLTTRRLDSNSQHYKKNICLQNDADLLMVLDTLNFISASDNRMNIYNYFNDLIIRNNIKKAYAELTELSGIGDKISTFFLRDIILFNNYDFKNELVDYVFAVDTWVAQITSLIAQKEYTTADSKSVREYYNKHFSAHNLALIAAGVWYLGANSLEIAVTFVKNNRIAT